MEIIQFVRLNRDLAAFKEFCQYILTMLRVYGMLVCIGMYYHEEHAEST